MSEAKLKLKAAKSKPKSSVRQSKRLNTLPVLYMRSLSLLWRNKWVFLGILLIYAVVNFLLAQSITGGMNVNNLKATSNSLFHGQFQAFSGGLTVFAVLLGSEAGTYKSYSYGFILLLIVSLALIWTIRQLSNVSQTKVRIRDAFYQGMYPFIPFIIVLLVIALELVPLIIGGAIYTDSILNGVAVTIPEKAAFVFITVGLAAITAYWLTGSIFALYIVTLPGMTPIKALKTASQLVSKRRLQILLRLICLPLGLLIAYMIIMLPVIIWIAPISQFVLILLIFLSIAIVNSYLYSLYQDLLP